MNEEKLIALIDILIDERIQNIPSIQGKRGLRGIKGNAGKDGLPGKDEPHETDMIGKSGLEGA